MIEFWIEVQWLADVMEQSSVQNGHKFLGSQKVAAFY
jgi:hypothetical protein